MNEATDTRRHEHLDWKISADTEFQSNLRRANEKDDSGLSTSDFSTSSSFDSSLSSPITPEPPVRDSQLIDKNSPFWRYLNSCSANDEKDEENDEGPKPARRRFFPYSLHAMRHEVALKQLKRHDHLINVLVDFGCASGEFLKRAIRLLPRIENIVGVDVDQSELTRAFNRIKPDYEDHFDQVEGPLTIQLYKGSVADVDRRLFYADAVVGIELIEHVNDATLKLLPWVIFGQIRPFLVILSTPNVEFNVAFDMGDRIFRHSDHKFEWTRQQFQSWCEKITVKFPEYWVKFTGVGDPPAEHPLVGFCTQIAVFRMRRDTYAELKVLKCNDRLDEIKNRNARGVSYHEDLATTDFCDGKPYELMFDIKYPTKLSASKMQFISFECHMYCMKLIQQREGSASTESTCGCWFDFKEILKNPQISKYFKDEAEFGLCLIDQNWTVDLAKMRAFYEPDIPEPQQNYGDSSSDEEN